MKGENFSFTYSRLLFLIIFCFSLQSCGSVNWPVPIISIWYNNSWLYRQQITISSSMTPSNQTDFPVLIKITDQSNPIFGRALSTGNDILFTSSDSTTKLNHEIESYVDTGTKELNAWVKIPTLPSSTNTIIYMYYGNNGASNQGNPTGVWDSNYGGVWHMAEDPFTSSDGDCGGGTKEVCDSTSNNNDADSFGTMTSGDSVTGQVGKAIDFDNSESDYLSVAKDSSFEPATTISITGWVKISSPPGGTWNPILDHSSTIGGGDGYNITLDTGGGWIYWWGGGFNALWDSVAGYNDGNWHMFAATYDGSIAELQWYKDGAPDGTWTTGASSITYANYPLYIGYDNKIGGTSNIYFNGTIDEVRISSTVRSDGWIKTSYNNQNNPSTYLTFGAQESF